MFFVGVCIIGLVVLCIKRIVEYFSANDPQKIFGVYSQKGKWFYLKYNVIRVAVIAQRVKSYLNKRSPLNDPKRLEKLQHLSDHPKAFDAVFFQGVSQDGIYFCGGTERRQAGEINGLFYILVPKYGLLMSKKLPYTTLKANAETIWSMKEYSAEGITFAPLEPMKSWKISFKGEMRSQQDPTKMFDVELNGTWSSDMPWVLFEREIPISVLCRAIAREPWSEKLFKSLKEAHQTHYEQMGYFEGTLGINNETLPLQLDSFRDHSLGNKRDWSLMHRYIFHMMYLSNGARICVGVVSQPCTTSHLEMGYVVDKNRKTFAIEDCDLLLYQHGENGTPPETLSFTFVAKKITYAVRVRYEFTAVHYVGSDKEAKMHERFFTCDVDGVVGRGISEWHYNNVNGNK